MITTDYKASEKTSTIYIAELQTAVILTDHSTKVMFNECSEKTFTIYTVKSQIAAILTDYSRKTMFTEHLKKTSIINTAKSQTAVTSMICTTIVMMNKASDKACNNSYLKLQSTEISVQSLSAQFIYKVKLIFYEDTIENFRNIKNIEII